MRIATGNPLPVPDPGTKFHSIRDARKPEYLNGPMNTPKIPNDTLGLLQRIDDFIDREIIPLQLENDNQRFFDHRRENSRTDWDNQGLPRKDWEDLLHEMRRRADKAGFLRYALPKEFDGQDGSNLDMAIIREHLAHKGLGLFNDLQNESSVVGNMPTVLMLRDFGTEEQRRVLIPKSLTGEVIMAFGLTEPDHGSDATWMETTAVLDKPGWYKINGRKMWNTGVHVATHNLVFARTDGKRGDGSGITCFIVPLDSPGFIVDEYMWTFNMPTDHPVVTFKDVMVPESAILGKLGQGLIVAQHFVHENRIRQAASSLGAAQYCIEESIAWAKYRAPFGKPLAQNQAIQFPLVELATQAAMLRALIRTVAAEMDTMPKTLVAVNLSDKISMCNYQANRLCCEAADRAIQIHGGWGYSRHKPFEHIYRHHRRYRITEGSEEIQMRKVGLHLFGFEGVSKTKTSAKL